MKEGELTSRKLKIVKSNDIYEHKKAFNNNKITYKKRNPYIDCVRIVGMYAIIIHHILFHGEVMRKYKKYRELRLMNTFSFWHVSSFALISGIVGYKSNKYSNLLFLWLCALFYSIYIHLSYKIFKPISVNKISIFSHCFPVVFHKYWYFTQYFGMYLFLPFINNGITTISQGDLKIVILSLLGIFIFWKDFMTNADSFRMANGYSVFWLLVFYIVGTYFGKYKININGKLKLIFYLICIVVFFGSTLLCFYLPFYKGKYSKLIIIIKTRQVFCQRINSLTMILQTISLTLFFSQIKYNKYIGKIITFFGPLTFGVYLIHENEHVRRNIIKKLFAKDSVDLSLKTVIFLVIYRAFLIFIICSIIDYFRHIIFMFFKVRKICIYLEKKIRKLFI